MPKTRHPYTAEFRRQVVELAHSGRDPDDLAREFEPTAQSIRAWIAKADKQEGRRAWAAKRTEVVAGLSPTDQEELTRLRREVRQVRVERDILSNQRVSGSACGGRNGQAYSPDRR